MKSRVFPVKNTSVVFGPIHLAGIAFAGSLSSLDRARPLPDYASARTATAINAHSIQLAVAHMFIFVQSEYPCRSLYGPCRGSNPTVFRTESQAKAPSRAYVGYRQRIYSKSGFAGCRRSSGRLQYSQEVADHTVHCRRSAAMRLTPIRNLGLGYALANGISTCQLSHLSYYWTQ